MRNIRRMRRNMRRERTFVFTSRPKVRKAPLKNLSIRNIWPKNRNYSFPFPFPFSCKTRILYLLCFNLS